MRQLVVIAEEQERKLAEQYFPEMPVLVTGVGALNIMKSLRDIPIDTEIFNIGYAGSADFEIGTVVCVTEARLNHPNVQYPEPACLVDSLQLIVDNSSKQTDSHPSADGQLSNTKYQLSTCYTGVDFCLQSDYKNCVFDMELAFICGMGFEHVHAIKIVSDNLSLHEYRTTGGQGV